MKRKESRSKPATVVHLNRRDGFDETPPGEAVTATSDVEAYWAQVRELRAELARLRPAN